MISFGIMLSQSSQASKISESLGFVGRLGTVEKRLKRWLANTRIDVETCCQHFIVWLWTCCDMERAILLVDETKLGNRMGCMVVALAFDKRAIPIMWRCYRANRKADYPAEGQVQMIVTMLEKVMTCLPQDSRPLIQADRGIGCSSNLMKACKKRRWTYLFRLQKTCLFTSRRGKTMKLSQLAHRNEVWVGYGRLFSKPERYLNSYVFVAWSDGQQEPWVLATNDPTVESHTYAIRMWQELSFKDLKSAGWQWQDSYLTDPERVSRLLLALTLAYAWTMTQGTFVLHSEKLIRDICDGDRHAFSTFRAGLRFFKRMIYQPEKIYMGLFLVPRYSPLPKSVP
ncbi:MAG: hypothetical protein Phog2KO_49790 [Phototrophicaceae bacterium]